MHFLHRILPVAACLAPALICACSDDIPPMQPAPPGEATYRWMNPVSGRASLTDVWGPAADNLFATGGGGIVLRFDGDAWRLTQTPASGTLNAIWGADATHAFAVGQDGVILFFNGTSWTQQASPTANALNDVWGSSATDVYAVGQHREVIHFDGASWDTVPVDAGIEPLYSIWGSDPANIYATGLDRNLLHYDGSSWGEVATNATFSLNAVWGTDSLDVFAVGGNGAVAHFDGVAWSNIDIGEPLFPLSVWGTATDDVYAMGSAAGVASTAYHWDGLSWSPVVMNSIKGVNRVFGVGGKVVAVGQAGLVHEKSGSEFIAVPGGETADLDAVWVAPAGDEAFAVGELGTILHFENGAWSPMQSGTTSHLRGLGGNCPCDVLAVGDDGVVLRYGGGAWTDVSPGVAVRLNEVWMDATGAAFVVGDGATVMRFENGGWTPLSLGSVTHELLSVWGSSPDNVYVVGRQSAAFRWTGTQFKMVVIDPPGIHNFHSVHGTAADDVFVASELLGPAAAGAAHVGGHIFHYDGLQWTSVFADPVHDVLSVWRYGRQGFATGDSATLLRDPAGEGGWARVLDIDNLPLYVNSVSGSSIENVFIVGNDGTIVRYSP